MCDLSLQNATLVNYKEAQIKQQKFVAELQVYRAVKSVNTAIQFHTISSFTY